MRTASALLLAMGVAGISFVTARFVYRTGSDTRQAPALPDLTMPIGQDTRASSPPPPELDLSESRVPLVSEKPAAPESAPLVPEIVESEPVVDPSDPRTLPEGTLLERRAKREAIQGYLNERTSPIIVQRFDDGLSEKVADGDTYSRSEVSELERTTIYGLKAEPGRGWYRTVLSREQYPELYVYKDEIIRLDEAIEAEERQQAQQRTSTPR